ncbi:energy transducer TonB [Photobacterium jeanii]|uniref:Protein TonB n=1 Tax=Photobacterium jeanii TaxID=858640 RepID=A0A178KK58_9GAMM|nr:energy transducer TonB [Photobacterium jeanii]OAN17699.1 energy transducer TonB [Photobacterium jeanii]PST92643.1 energy transducer TonB [Photobacterium jeanii]
MNIKRYILAGSASILFHTIIFSAVPTKTVMAMPVGAESTRVSLNLVSVPQPKPQPVQEVTPTPQPEVKPVVKKQPVQTKQKKLVKKKVKTQKEVAPKKTPPKPTPKPEPRKVVKKETKPVKKKVEKTVKSTAEQSKPQVKNQASSGVNSQPKLVSQPTFATRPSPVQYPRIAKRRGIEGQVLVEIWIDSSGKQVKQRLIKSSGANVLDDAAIAAIKDWKFSSHIIDGQAIAHRVQIPVRFKLD